MTFVFAITLSVSLAIGCLLGWHTYLALTAQTTIEFYYNRYVCVCVCGSWCLNVRASYIL